MIADRKTPTRHTVAALQRLTMVLTVTLAAVAGQWTCTPSPAYAVPSFARQTGMPCTACHTNFPLLTPFGRAFKLNGYVMRGAQQTDSWQDMLKDVHLAAMVLPSFTHTNKDQPQNAAPHFGENDNFAVTQISLFYAGQLFWKVGAFVQGTWDGVARQWSWDNVDIRFANTTTFADRPLVYGTTLNNNPTVQDLWNTTPAWSFPFTASGVAPAPAASTLIQGGFSQQVLGFGAYAMWDDLIYAEGSAYRTLPFHIQQGLGVDPEGEAEISGVAPYWRLALQHAWGSHYLEVGHFGLWASTYPGRDETAQTDHTSDLGFDSQYQYFSPEHDVTLLSSWIREDADWNASRTLGLTDKGANVLNAINLSASYLYDKTFGLTIGFFDINGRHDATLFGDSRTGSADSYGEIIQLDYLPFNKNGGPWFWPYSNVKLSAQYTLYQQFDGAHSNIDGAGRHPSDNNTLYLESWIAF